VHFSFKGLVLSIGMILLSAATMSVWAQNTSPTPSPSPTAPPKPKPTPKPEKTPKPDKNAPIVLNVDQVAETAIIVYGSRNGMTQVKRTTYERGKMIVNYPDGSVDNATYEKRVIRGENTEKDKLRIDFVYPSVKYGMIFNGKISGVIDGAAFTPLDEAIASFEAQIWHSFDTLFRYKENGSTIKLDEKQKSMGVEYYVLDVTDKQQRKTRFFLSTKTLRILSMEYTEGGVKFTKKYYDYRIAQGLLVPFRTVTFANDKQVEESSISTVTYGQKVEDSFFEEN
jgi:hypothetical protein